MSSGNFLVLKSSAGSGKTFALVRNFLRLALETKDASAYRHILAITFTNAAAAEMKERVLKNLAGFSEGAVHPDFNPALFASLISDLDVAEEELIARSKDVYGHMLHHYDQLSISTIDSFIHKLIRSFAFDLKLHSEFLVEMETDRFIEEVVDECLELAGTDEALTSYLIQFVLDELEEESSWNIREKLLSFARILLREDSIVPLESLDGLTLDDFTRLRKSIWTYIGWFENEIASAAKQLLSLIEKNSISVEDFSRQSVPRYLTKLQNGELEQIGKTIEKAISDGRFYTKAAPAGVRERMDSMFKELSLGLEKIQARLSGDEAKKFHVSRLVVRNMHTLGLLSQLNHFGKKWREENNTLLISDFHRLISEVIQDNPAPFIYERAGTRYRHILIDEFQDTSEMQWKNFLPLIENSLSNGNFSLLVGDGKQAIYRWRNGNVEQFVNLPNVDAKKNFLLASAYREEPLDSNYRSAKAIVQFNNALYAGLKSSLQQNQIVFNETEQKTTRDAEGFVMVKKVTGPTIETRMVQTLDQILDYVLQCLADGFAPQDIAILVRRNAAEKTPIANYLVQNGIPIQTDESFLLTNSLHVNLVMNALRYFIQPTDRANRILLARNLCEHSSGTISFSDALQQFSSGEGRDLAFDVELFLLNFFPNLLQIKHTELSLSETVATIFSALQLEMDSFLESFFDQVLARQNSHHDSTHQFVKWFDQNSYKLYSTAVAQDAVRIMTIHKAKGLQFPVVIYPRFHSENSNTSLWIDARLTHTELKNAYVRFSKPDEFSPPEFHIESEKQLLDDLNVMYVATTRAEERLYFIVERKKESDGESETTNWPDRIDRVMLNSFSTYFLERDEWSLGQCLPAKKGNSKPVSNEHVLNGVNLFSEIHSTNRAVETEVLSSAAQRRGRLIHMLLAQGGSVNVISEFKKFSIEPIEWESLQQEIARITGHENFVRWFKTDAQVKAESELLTPEGKILRPDRVVLFDDHIEVVDFKTGTPHPKHDEQVKEYVSILQRMYPKAVKGYLAYISDMSVREVE